MTKIVYAAGSVAHKLHTGQMDKGGNDYFESHLLKVASRGFDWKEKVVGFLHDASEDCDVTVEDVLRMLDAEISKVVENPEENWWEEWMEDIDVYPCEVTHSITDEEREELKNALNLLNHHTASSREEYIAHISENRLALRVKMHDLENNMDLTRIPQPTAKDFARVERYRREYEFLTNALHNCVSG
ncbi:phosphohydrolase [Paramuribaculum intestinale]|uniref:Phosphohydrolase n=2 Tax=Muribaculaceae TaxID=2005473 RepID=A0A2V1IV97_9BACT|nr:phosphohydrolase [Paramuribaculum intestinale]ROS84226.1 phosphohydrolase [Muribaculaceae bacterium Isolate-036 (Harlan)]ROS88070.1 phosphohydrolase [Muribaculaceae bacterium Isolate-043 (Harlan)]PWB01004.1 phosphohydrolase [Paramuribaculum intestinale]PWB05943.1 phosphohydrolase [Paramuribaculum intestinale]WLT43226.1 phosphohydrolase [Paramuribaculum intestinale]